MACRRPSVSVARIERECGVNANQVNRWLREHEQRVAHDVTPSDGPAEAAFVAVRVELAQKTAEGCGARLQARLANGMVADLRVVDAASIAAAIDALGRLRCTGERVSSRQQLHDQVQPTRIKLCRDRAKLARPTS